MSISNHSSPLRGVSVSDSGGSSDNMRQVPSICIQLCDAIKAGNMLSLREILSRQNKSHHGAVFIATDNDIEMALFFAAGKGSVEAYRLLWERLSATAKQRFFATRSGAICIFNEAVLNGQFQVVRFFIQECNFNVNQESYETPLCAARYSEEMTRLLLDAGANPNGGPPGEFGPLRFAVCNNHIPIVQLLLQRGANANKNRRPSNQENWNRHRRNTDYAIRHGYVEILSLLLQHGAFVDEYNYNRSLNGLLRNQDKSHQTKLSISRLLAEHARRDPATASFMQRSLASEIEDTIRHHGNGDIGYCEIMFEAGVDPVAGMCTSIRARGISVCQLLVREYHIDPFLVMTVGENITARISPFVAAARQRDTTIFEYFLDLWNERFSIARGKNSDGNYPIHVVCYDAHVSVQAIRVVLDRQAETLWTVDGKRGLLPLHSVAMCDARPDVVYSILKHWPDALHHRHVENADVRVVVGSVAAVTVETNDDINNDNGTQKDQSGIAAASGCGTLT